MRAVNAFLEFPYSLLKSKLIVGNQASVCAIIRLADTNSRFGGAAGLDGETNT